MQNGIGTKLVQIYLSNSNVTSLPLFTPMMVIFHCGCRNVANFSIHLNDPKNNQKWVFTNTNMGVAGQK